MEPQIRAQVYELLETMCQALAHLREGGDDSLLDTVREGRKAVTALLDQALDTSLTRRVNADRLPDDEWVQMAYLVLGELEDPFQPRNAFDRQMLSLLQYFWDNSEKTLLKNLKQKMDALKEMPGGEENYKGFVEYFARFPLWGTLDPREGCYDTLERRAAVLKRHSYDFLWLYRRLEDYLSRQTLFAILYNWALLDLQCITRVKSIFPDYWEPDIFPDNDGDVLVDVGAYVGDSIGQYVNMYGTGYRRIYAYEISPESCAALAKNTAHLHDVVVRQKGAGARRGSFSLSLSSDPSANQVGANGGGEQVEVVPLDEDIEEPITFLKMDIEGAEWDALMGCEGHITRDRPRLAICVYHGYDDLWRIPRMIECMEPHYHMYLRHNGGNLIPTEFVLLCRPEKD